MDIRKQELIKACKSYVGERMDRILSAISDLEEALKLETKCSMGDKYETGRAMLHLEFEKLSVQLEQYRRLEKTLTLINGKSNQKEVGFGSVIRTQAANYFLAIPAGEMVVEGESYYCVGAVAPIAQAFLGKKTGDEVVFNGKTLSLLEVF